MMFRSLSIKSKNPILVLLAAIYSLYLIIFVIKFSVNVPYMDEWNLLDKILTIYTNDYNLISIFKSTHNEHLVGFSFYLMSFIHTMTDFNVKSMIEISLLLNILTAGLLLFLIKTIYRDLELKTLVIIYILFLSLSQYQNYLWGFQFPWFEISFLYVSTLLILRKTSIPRIAVSFLFAILASFSSMQGFIIFPAVYVYILFSKSNISCGKYQFHPSTVWAFLSVLYLLCIYSSSLVVSANYNLNLLVFFQSLLQVLATPFALKRTMIYYFIGLIVLIQFLCATYLARVDFRKTELSLPISMITFGFLFALIVTYGRYKFGIDALKESRYSSYIIFLYIGMYLFFDIRKQFVRYKFAYELFLVVSVVFSIFVSLRYAVIWRADREVSQAILLDYKNSTKFQVDQTLFPNYDFVLKSASLLKSNHLSVFASDNSNANYSTIRFTSMPKTFIALIKTYPSESESIEALWKVYVVSGDLRRAFPSEDVDFHWKLFRWLNTSFITNDHYASRELIKYRSSYEKIWINIKNDFQ